MKFQITFLKSQEGNANETYENLRLSISKMKQVNNGESADLENDYHMITLIMTTVMELRRLQ